MALSRRALLLVVFAGLALAAAGGVLVVRLRGENVPPDPGPVLIFAEFGPTADRIYTAPATDPARRSLVTTVQHVAEWGLNPGLGPAGTRVAYTVLPTSARPQADSPAEVWLLDVASGKQQRLAGDADLRVPPVLDAEGRYLVYRASASGGRQSLIRVNLADGTRRPLYEAETAFGMFPVGLTKDGALVFASLSNSGTDFFRVAEGGQPVRLLHASDQLARDWRLSPRGDALAYLAPVVRAERVVYRLEVARLDAASASEMQIAAPGTGEQYGAAWTSDGGAVTVGQQPEGAAAAPAASLPIAGGAPVTLVAPPRGFDQPLGWSPDGEALVVRSFDGTSSAAPGKESTAVITGGERRAVTGTGDIIYFGWMPR